MLLLLAQGAWAQSLSYHLERISLQAQSLQDQLLGLEQPTWGQQTAGDDLRKLRASSEAFAEALAQNPLPVDQALQYLVQLEVAAARVRTSRDIGGFSPAQLLTLDELQVEVKEVRRSLESQREQAERRQRSASRVSFGVGFGYPGWGYPGWGYPGWGYSGWGYRPIYAPICRPVFRRHCRR